MKTMSEVRDGDILGDIVEIGVEIVMIYWTSRYENLNAIL
jgi:hypothetical protein